MGPLIPLFWTSGDISSGFQSQSGFCLYFTGLQLLSANILMKKHIKLLLSFSKMHRFKLGCFDFSLFPNSKSLALSFDQKHEKHNDLDKSSKMIHIKCSENLHNQNKNKRNDISEKLDPDWAVDFEKEINPTKSNCKLFHWTTTMSANVHWSKIDLCDLHSPAF